MVQPMMTSLSYTEMALHNEQCMSNDFLQQRERLDNSIVSWRIFLFSLCQSRRCAPGKTRQWMQQIKKFSRLGGCKLREQA